MADTKVIFNCDYFTIYESSKGHPVYIWDGEDNPTREEYDAMVMDALSRFPDLLIDIDCCNSENVFNFRMVERDS